MNEEELQNNIEAGKPLAGKDALAYRKVFEALTHEPEFNLPVNFAGSVMERIQAKQESASRKEYFLIAGIVIFFMLAAIVTCVMTGYSISLAAFQLKTDLSAFRFVKNYSSLFVFGGIFIFLLQWVDRRFIRPRVVG